MMPHTLRRTFVSMLAVCDVPPRRAMYLMGHTDPTLTLAVYQQVLNMGKGAVEILEQTLGARWPRLARSTTAKREPPKSTKKHETVDPRSEGRRQTTGTLPAGVSGTIR